MATTYEILRDKRLIVVTSSGEIDPDETIRSLEQLYGDPEYSPDYDLLWDASETTTVFTYDDMQRLIQHYKSYSGDKHPKRAIVVPPNGGHGRLRVFEGMLTIRSRAQIGLFFDRKEALKWLGR
ncbi:MAG TPA: hypothetical protein PLA74_06080 [Syntrophales bacterium]|nr:hypothetical protein [Syntrophales bacterium]